MKRLATVLGALVLAFSVATSGGCRKADAALYAGYVETYSATCRTCAPVIWVIGDSIGHGAIPIAGGGFAYTGGWRRYVYGALVAAGRTPTMVGGLSDASDGLASTIAGDKHNGNNGATTANWVASYYATYQPGLGSTPTIVIICTGANDPDTVGSGQSIGQLADLVVANYPLANVLVGTKLPSIGAASTINAQIAVEVSSRFRAGKHVQMVDTFSVVGMGDLGDGLHPTQSGYAKLGEAWRQAVVPLVAR